MMLSREKIGEGDGTEGEGRSVEVERRKRVVDDLTPSQAWMEGEQRHKLRWEAQVLIVVVSRPPFYRTILSTSSPKHVDGLRLRSLYFQFIVMVRVLILRLDTI